MTEILTGSQILCRALLEEGVDVLFGYPGGAIMPFYHALPEYPGPAPRAGAARAGGGARGRRLRPRDRPGRASAWRRPGPGATNLVTGLATAHMDSTPVVAITGQVPRAMIGRDAFQETDIIGITQPITKHSRAGRGRRRSSPTRCARRSRSRVEGRPGPVLLDIPKDVQNQKADWTGGSGRTAAREAAAGRRASAVRPSAPCRASTKPPGSSPRPSGRSSWRATASSCPAPTPSCARWPSAPGSR